MPSHDTHSLLDALLFGRKKSKKLRGIHELMDAPVKAVGPSHRKYLHDPATALILGALSGDSDVMMSAFGHEVLDGVSTKLNSKARKKLLGMSGN